MTDLAVLNNIVWCEMVCGTHGISSVASENVWGLLSAAPAFYPDIITSSSKATVEDIEIFIGARKVNSIKDSYANLDLVPLGYGILLEAEWIYHASVLSMPSNQTSWRAIAAQEDFAQWILASGLEHVIKPELLHRKDVKIYLHDKNGNISGFIAAAGAHAVGITNVFSFEHAEERLWSDMVKIVSNDFPGLPLVGYEQNGELAAALQCGWKSVGPIRVWMKSSR